MTRLEADGFAVVENVGSPDALTALREAFAAPVADGAGGVRNVLRDVPAARAAAVSNAVQALVKPILGGDCFAVRGILFDKTADGANWKVPFHQDLSVAVSRRPDNPPPDWGAWTEKAGVAHGQPPAALLARMLTVRLHLDDCGIENSPLRVLPGTHRHGRLSPPQIAAFRESVPEVACTVDVGGAVVMRPLLLHASSPVMGTTAGARRRVLHVEYAPADATFPEGLDWYERTG